MHLDDLLMLRLSQLSILASISLVEKSLLSVISKLLQPHHLVMQERTGDTSFRAGGVGDGQ
jgi:hypothetical protein